MNPFQEYWGVEAYSVDGDANINRVYFTGNGWSKDISDMLTFSEPESIVLKRTFERQGLLLHMHKMTENNPAPCAREDQRNSRDREIDRRN